MKEKNKKNKIVGISKKYWWIILIIVLIISYFLFQEQVLQTALPDSIPLSSSGSGGGTP